MKVQLGASSVTRLLKTDVVNAFFSDRCADTGHAPLNDKVVFSIFPGVAKGGFCEVLDEIAASGIKVEVDTTGFVFLPSWQSWEEGRNDGIYLHGVRFTRVK
ncbi:MAG: hypothetical protein HYT93_03985 [Parcubacteria group bacterium]|nr:hypothetical protein [Parcubacteria group bacterium]